MIPESIAAAALLRAGITKAVAPVIGTAADYAAALQCPPARPAIYVGPLDENASRTTAYETLQNITGQIAVLYMVSAASEDAGRSDPLERLQALREAVRTLLVGWKLGVTHEPTEFASGRLLDASNGEVTWQDNFRIGYHPPSGDEEPELSP